MNNPSGNTDFPPEVLEISRKGWTLCERCKEKKVCPCAEFGKVMSSLGKFLKGERG